MTRINSITIQDTFGISSISVKPKSVTRFKGKNGKGKSSMIRALFEIFDGGTNPSCIRHGAEKSVVELGLEDGTSISKTTRPKRARRGGEQSGYTIDLVVSQPDGTPRNAPQTYIGQLASADAVDPGKILRIDTTKAPGRKELAELLLSIVPISFTAQEVESACVRPGLTAVDQHGKPVIDNRGEFSLSDLALPAIKDTLDLDGLKKYIAAVTEQRRRTGSERDDADGAVNTMRQALPADDGVDYDVELANLEAYERQVRDADRDNRLEIERMSSEGLATAMKTRTEAFTGIDEDINAKIKALESERTQRKSVAMEAWEASRKLVVDAAAEALETLKGQVDPALQSVATDMATFKAKRDEQKRSKWTKEQIEVNLRKFQVADRKYSQLSEVIARLEDLRKEKLDSLPVPGLEVTGAEVFVDGTPWHNVNTARKIEIAIHLCTLISGELGIIFLDDAEHLATETRSLLEEGLVAAGFQLFEAIVTDDEALTIETVDVPA